MSATTPSKDTHDDAVSDRKDGDVKSRSADPGQSSYGGFKNEGPSKEAERQQRSSDEAAKKP